MKSDMPNTRILRAAKGGKKKDLLKHSPPYFHSEHKSLIVNQSQISIYSPIMRGKLGKNSFFFTATPRNEIN